MKSSCRLIRLTPPTGGSVSYQAPKRRKSFGTLFNPETLMISKGILPLTQVHDRQDPRGSPQLYGRAHRTGLSDASSRDRTPPRVLGVIQAQVNSNLLRYREVERRELDRHSYEVQIKELTQQLTEKTVHETENLKLRDFLKKQTV